MNNRRLWELARLFLRLGATAFGGPAVHVALMEDEVVRRRGWLTREQFLDYVGATNLIPGPNSTELAIHIGHLRAGWPGLLVAGACFIAPATLIVTFLAWVYVSWGTVPQVQGVLYGVKPVVLAVVAQALWGLTRSAVKTSSLMVLLGASIAAAAFGVHELVVLLAAGVLAAVAGGTQRIVLTFSMAWLRSAWVSAATAGAAVAAAVAAPVTMTSLFLVFLKAGAVLYGSGYVLLAFIRADLVERLGWLTESQVLDAIAIGQVTPGPVFTTATFVGYLVAGTTGAAVATIGIFLPAFVFVALSGPLVPRLRRSTVAGRVLDGVNVASLALMAVVSWHLGRSALVDVPTLVLCVGSAVALVGFRLNSTWLIAVGALVGWMLT
jgi:chromate transporter